MTYYLIAILLKGSIYFLLISLIVKRAQNLKHIPDVGRKEQASVYFEFQFG